LHVTTASLITSLRGVTATQVEQTENLGTDVLITRTVTDS